MSDSGAGSWVYGVRFLQNLADAQGLSQAKWAKKADLSPSFVSEVFSGKKKATDKVLIALCGALGVDSRLAFPASFPEVSR
jgi:transcriptional regulator with XRE-family HTH domain